MERIVEIIKNNGVEVEIELYNYTRQYGIIVDSIEKFEEIMKNTKDEIVMDNLVVDGITYDKNLDVEELKLVIESENPKAVIQVMKMDLVDVERAIQIVEDSYVITADNKQMAFREWFEETQFYMNKKIEETEIVPGIRGMESYLDWESIMRDFELSNNVEIYKIDNFEYLFH